MPDGASFGGKGVAGANVGGVRTWTFTEARFSSGLSFTPPQHLHGEWSITATTTAVEQEATNTGNNTAVSDPKVFKIKVDGQADPAAIGGSGAIGNEDSAIAFGSTLAADTASGIRLVDRDGSERITEITLRDFPVGVTPTYSLVGTGAVSVSSGVYTITGASEADIRATLATFSLTPPANSDGNITIKVTATTTDAISAIDPAGISTTTATIDHTIVVRAVADQPTLTVTPTATGAEDSPIPLAIATNRTDTDGSESLSVRITLSAPIAGGTILGDTSGGGSIANQGGGVFLVTAPTEAQLDAILSTIAFRGPTNWSGTASMTVEAISTETGPEIAVATATNSSTISVTVGAIADAPVLKVVPSIGGASGLEDTPVRLSIAVTIPDSDGSETYVVRLSGQPAGAVYTNASGAPIGTKCWRRRLGVHTGAARDPAHRAAAELQRGFLAERRGDHHRRRPDRSVRDHGHRHAAGQHHRRRRCAERGDAGEHRVAGGPADPAGREHHRFSRRRRRIGIALLRHLRSAGRRRSLARHLHRRRMADLGGRHAVRHHPAPLHFSGDYVATFAPSLVVRAVTQENDGDEAVSNITVNISITPVVDAFSWSPSVTLRRKAPFRSPRPRSADSSSTRTARRRSSATR